MISSWILTWKLSIDPVSDHSGHCDKNTIDWVALAILTALESGKSKISVPADWVVGGALFLYCRQWPSHAILAQWREEALGSLPLLTMGTPPSWPHRNLITSRRPGILMPSHGGGVFELQHMNVGGPKCSVHNRSQLYLSSWTMVRRLLKKSLIFEKF